MNKPDWKDSPSWAMWLAQDAFGGWWWYEKKPVAFQALHGFVADHATGERYKRATPSLNWKDTLEERPDEGL